MWGEALHREVERVMTQEKSRSRGDWMNGSNLQLSVCSHPRREIIKSKAIFSLGQGFMALQTEQGCGLWQSKFKVWLCHMLLMWPWEGHLTTISQFPQMQNRKSGYRSIGRILYLVKEFIYLFLQKYSLSINYMPCAMLDVGTLNKTNMSAAFLELVF